jgi:hypothetical protein
MKYVAVLLVLLVGALAYVRFEQPTDWNNYLNSIVTALKAPDGASSGSAAATNASTAANASDAESDASSSTPVPAPAPSVPAPVTTDEIISPDSTNYINPDHVRPVQQPGEAPAPTNVPATNAPSTNAPATNAPQ